MVNELRLIKLLLIMCISVLIEGCTVSGSIKSLSQNNNNNGITFSGAIFAENISGTSIQINWKRSSSEVVKSYNIYQVNSDSSLLLVGVASSTASLFVHSGLNFGRLYRYIVRASTSEGLLDNNTQVVSAIPYAGIATATVIDSSTVDLTFNRALDAQKLRIYCAEGGSSVDMILVATLDPYLAAYHLTGLTPQSLYSCKVKALLTDGSEDFNGSIVNFTPDTVSTGSSLGFAGIATATNTTGSSALVSWLAATPAAGVTLFGYRVYQINSDGLLSVYNVANNLTSYTINNLIPGENYSFIVRAINAADSSTDNNQLMKTVLMYEGITSTTPTGPTSATLTFPAAPLASSLNIYCYESSGSIPSTPTASIASSLTFYTINTLVTATNYTCLVKAVGLEGEDGNSVVSTFLTP